MNRVGHSLQPLIADPLAVHAGHRFINVVHDGIHRHLIPRLSANRLEDVSQRVEAEPPSVADARFLEQTCEALRQRGQYNESSPRPSSAATGPGGGRSA